MLIDIRGRQSFRISRLVAHRLQRNSCALEACMLFAPAVWILIYFVSGQLRDRRNNLYQAAAGGDQPHPGSRFRVCVSPLTLLQQNTMFKKASLRQFGAGGSFEKSDSVIIESAFFLILLPRAQQHVLWVSTCA